MHRMNYEAIKFGAEQYCNLRFQHDIGTYYDIK